MSLQQRLAKYLMARPGVKVSKGQLCDLARDSDLKATGEHTGRRLRYLESCHRVKGSPIEEPEHIQARALLKGGAILVEHRKRNHDWYWYEPQARTAAPLSFKETNDRAIRWFDELPTTS